MIFFKRPQENAPSDPYTTLPPYRRRRQSAPPKSSYTSNPSAPDVPTSHLSRPWRSIEVGRQGDIAFMNGEVVRRDAGSMRRQRSKSTSGLHEAASQRPYYGAIGGGGRIKNEINTKLGGYVPGYLRELALVDKWNENREPEKSNFGTSNIFTPLTSGLNSPTPIPQSEATCKIDGRNPRNNSKRSPQTLQIPVCSRTPDSRQEEPRRRPCGVNKPDPRSLLQSLDHLLNHNAQIFNMIAGVFSVEKGAGVGLGESDNNFDSSIVKSKMCVEDVIDIDDILAIHECDLMDKTGKEAWSGETADLEALTVFGSPLRQVYIYASTPTLFNTIKRLQNSEGDEIVGMGLELDLPIVVVSCVEELHRRGAFDIRLICSPDTSVPNSTPRVRRLINIYDSPRTSFGIYYYLSNPSATSAGLPSIPQNSVSQDRISANNENKSSVGIAPSTLLKLYEPSPTTEEIVSLLTIYLASLPDPVFPSVLLGALWAWCITSESGNADMRYGSRCGSRYRSQSPNIDEEKMKVLVAQILLRLMPSPNFALLVYLLAFLKQVVGRGDDDESDSKLGVVKRVFGRWLFGGEGNDKSEIITQWFLRRWDQIFDGLFEDDICRRVWSEGNVHISRDIPPDRERVDRLHDHSPKRVRMEYGRYYKGTSEGLSEGAELRAPRASWMPSNDAPGDFFGSSPAIGSAENLHFSVAGGVPERHNGTHDAVGTIQGDATAQGRSVNSSTAIDEDESVILAPSEGLFEIDSLKAMSIGSGTTEGSAMTQAEPWNSPSLEQGSLYSVEPALEERLLDVSLAPVIEDSHLGIFPTSASTSRSNSTTASSKSTKTTSTVVSISTSASSFDALREAQRYITALERELERSDVAVFEAISETFKARERIALLEDRIKELESGHGSLSGVQGE